MASSHKSESFLKSAWHKLTHAKEDVPLSKSRFEEEPDQQMGVGKKGEGSA